MGRLAASLKTLWALAFGLVLVQGLLVQGVVLPYFFPQAHWGHGLAVGGDWILFHTEAQALAERIQREGWGAWALRPPPSFQPMSGITAFFYALTGIPEPYVLLPYNAFLHATAFVVLIRILELLAFPRTYALLGALPFLLFPSHLTWTAQIHRDGLYILGAFLLVYTLLLVLKAPEGFLPWGPLALILWGGLWWVARPHMLFPGGYLLALAGVGLGAWVLLRRRPRVLLAGGSLIVLGLLAPLEAPSPPPLQAPAWRWHPSPYLPARLDGLLARLSETRLAFYHTWPRRPGNLDEGWVPDSAWAHLRYLPRALEVGFLYPGPSLWFTPGGTPLGSLGRAVTPLEMLLTYLAYVGFALWLWRNRRYPWAWVLVLVPILFVWLHVITEPNMGAIYRKRFGFVQILIGVGIAHAFSLLVAWKGPPKDRFLN